MGGTSDQQVVRFTARLHSILRPKFVVRVLSLLALQSMSVAGVRLADKPAAIKPSYPLEVWPTA